MVGSLHRVMVPAEQIPIVDTLGCNALMNMIPDLAQQISNLDVKVTGVWRDRSRYVFDVQLSSAAILDNVRVDVSKDMMESKTLDLLESMPLLKL